MQKRTRPIYSHLEQTSLVNKELIIWSLLGPTLEIRSRQDEPSLSAQLANQNVEFALSFPPSLFFTNNKKLTWTDQLWYIQAGNS